MYSNFDFFGYSERPQITLCNPDGKQLCSLGNAFNTQLSLKYNAMSEFSFDLMQTIQDSDGNDVIDPAYALLKSKRLVFIEEIGFFQIITPTEVRKNSNPVKNVQCVSWEVELVSKQVTGFKFGGSTKAKFYDPIDNSETFLGLILKDTNWGIGQIDEELWDVYRNFDIPSNNCYNTLMVEAEQAYNCIFTFDLFERYVNAIAIENASHSTDIFLSYDNLIKETTLKEISEEIVTAMNVQGGDGLDIRAVNPLGTNFIYDFSYYQTRDSNGNSIWISNGLNSAIDAWQDKITANQTTYATILSNLRNQYLQKAQLETDLLLLYDHDDTPPLGYGLNELIEIQKAQIENGNIDLTEINNKIIDKEADIAIKKSQITAVDANITGLTVQATNINNNLAITNIANFTLAQQAELKPLIIQNLYQNNNIIITSIMTSAEIQDQGLELYQQARDVLSRAAVPRYEFTMDLVNFVALKEYISFTNQLELGSLVTIENEEGVYIYTSVLEINLSFDDLTDFSIVFSNRLRLDNGSFIFSDLFNQANQGASLVAFNSGENAWGGYTANQENLLFVNTVLNAANNEIVNNDKQEIQINQHGLRGRKLQNNGQYSGNQIWVTNNLIAFSKDGFKTSSLALGQITLPGSNTKVFGLAAAALIGDMIAGAQLRIRNANNNFVLDSNGAVLTNASFKITSTNPSQPNDIELSPSTGLIIRKRGLSTAVFSADSSGNLNITGVINATGSNISGNVNMLTGTIGTTTDGLIVNSEGLFTKDMQYYAKGNGFFKWGSLTITPSSASFSGRVYANSISGQINGRSQIQDGTIPSAKIESLTANLITSGVIRAVDFWGGKISWGGTYENPGVIQQGINEDYSVDAGNTLYLKVRNNTTTGEAGSALVIGRNDVYMAAYSRDDPLVYTSALQLLYNGQITFIGENVYIPKANIVVNGGTGRDETIQVNTPSGVRTLTFSRGILVKYQ